ncbi:uncharacterized protein LOC113290157 isoform X2 [Papaver somniferum]|uniref:uncharacterized protein LOC113290157 isoform X2 n=1 Tax=Papaver somniferum TaxID=3469 RepID=UPI000E6F6DF8|nr:uncharacterized protein LOC113290157 isoform X2 [Papaver somniferum]
MKEQLTIHMIDSNMMEEDTPILRVGISATPCCQIDQCEGPVDDPQKKSIMNNEDAPVSEVGSDLTRGYQVDQDKEPLNDSPNDSNLIGEEAPIATAGIDLTQCFQTDQLFGSREAAIEWCHEVARKNNTTVVITRSNMNPANRRAFVDIGCQRGKKKYYRSKVTPDTRKRQSRESKKCDCPFSLRGICLAENKWRIRVSCGRHNHEGESTFVSYFNRGKKDEEQLVAELTASGARPQQVFQALNERNNKRPSLKRQAEKMLVMEHVNMMEENTPISNVEIEVTQCYQIDQKDNNMNKEDAPMTEVGADVTLCDQIDQDNELLGYPPDDSNLMVEEVGIDLTQSFQTDQLFDSREAAIEWCHEVARKNNTTVVIMRSNMNPANRRAFVDIGCQRGKKKYYRSKVTPDTRKRKSRESKKCDCPFSLRGIRLAENKWKIRVSCGRHNHEGESTSIPSFNRWKEDEEQLVTELTASGARPRQVLQALKEKNNKRPSLKRQAEKMLVMEHVNMMEENTPISNVEIDVTQCYQIDQCEGPVNDPQKDNNMNKEDAPMTEVGADVTLCDQIDQDKELLDYPPDDSNLMVEEVGIDLTQSFQTDQLFDSREAAIEWCHEVARKNNTTVVIMRSNMNPANRRAFVDIGCQRGKKKYYRSKVTPDTRKRQSRESKKCDCPFSLRGIRLAENKWKIRVSCGRHNHEGESTSIPSFNRWKEDEEQLVAELTASGARPRQVLQALKEKNKDCLVSARTIYNKRSSIKRQEAEKMSVMEQVVKLSTQYHYMVWHRKDEKTNELKDIVWAHPESTLLAKCFPSVLIIDCTYKTNRFKVPFFHIAGVSSLGTPFTVAYAFIEEETKEHFSWALTQLKFLFMSDTLPSVCLMNGEHPLINAVRVVFPEAKRLLCTLHIGESIVTNCRKEILDDNMWNNFYGDWECVVKAETKEAFVDSYTEFVTTWVARYPTCITYIRDTWMVHKESFILAWTQKIKHFGYTEITTDESEHDHLRKHMESSMGTMGFFFRCWETMHGIVASQIKQIRASNEKSLSSMNRKYEISAFEELNNHVSQHALDLIQLELNQSADIELKNQSTLVSIDITSCSCLIGYTHGLPCVHEVLHYTQEGSPIPLSAIDQQWKQLSMVLKVDYDFDFISQPEVRLLKQRWIEASESDRGLMEEKMREVLSSWDS